MADHPKNYSKSANRALDVMTFIARIGGPVRAAVIADALGIARSSADQLLKTMVDGGYLVVSVEDKTYLPSLRLAHFGRWIAGRYPMEACYHDIVADIGRSTGEIVAVTMQNDCFMQIMDAAVGHKDDPIPEIGARVPIFGSAIGSAALAGKSRPQISRLVARARRLRVLTSGNGMSLIDQIRSCQMKGYASIGRDEVRNRQDSDETIPYWSIAMMLPNTPRQATVVLGLSGQSSRVRTNERDIVTLMRRSVKAHLAI